MPNHGPPTRLGSQQKLGAHSDLRPSVDKPTHAVTEVTGTHICGSECIFHEALGAFTAPKDVLGREAVGTSSRGLC